MSLTSRIANLITSTQSPQLAPTDGCPSMGFEDGPYRTSNSANAASRRPFSESWAMEEKEAERRPRYLHVSWAALKYFVFVQSVRANRDFSL
jgi:hypothetical protein